MTVVLDTILPVFGTLFFGYLAARLRLISESGNYGLSQFVFNVAIPVMLFRAMALTVMPKAVPWEFLLSYYLGTFAAMGCGLLAGRFLTRRNLAEQGVMGMASCFSNTSMLGIPLILTAYGQPAALPLFTIIACHSAILLPPITLTIEAGTGQHEPAPVVFKRLLASMATTTIFWGLAAGIVVSVLGLSIPPAVDAVVKSIANSAVPCALFSLGASLVSYRIAGNLAEPVLLVVIKGILHPAFVWLLAFRVLQVEQVWGTVAVTAAALPSGVMTYIYAQKYRACQETAAVVVLLSTVFSVFTLSALLLIFK